MAKRRLWGSKIGNQILSLSFVECAEGGHPAFALLNNRAHGGIGQTRLVTG